MKLVSWLGLLFVLNVSTTAIAKDSAIKGEIKDVDLCGNGVLVEAVCSFEVPDLNRRRRRRLGGAAGGEAKNNHMVNVINNCEIKVDGEDVDSTVTAIDFCEVKFDETVKGDDVKLLLFTSKIKLADSDMEGLVKLEAFEYGQSDPHALYPGYMTTVKTFSIAWSGC